MFFQENLFVSSAVEAQTIVQQDLDGVLKRISSFVTYLSDILQRFAKQAYQPISSDIVDFLPVTQFEINICKQFVKNLAVSEAVSTRSTHKFLKNN